MICSELLRISKITVIKYSALQTLGCESKHSLHYRVSLKVRAVENEQRPAISTIDQTAWYQLTWFPGSGISPCWEKSACVRARVALLPLGWDINKVTVQLESGRIHSRAPYKADGDTSDLKKGESSKGSRLRKYVVTSVTIFLLSPLDSNSTVIVFYKNSQIQHFFEARRAKKEAEVKLKVSTQGRK